MSIPLIPDGQKPRIFSWVEWDGFWYLYENNRPRHGFGRPWKPADRWDVMVARTVIYLFNGRGPVPIKGRELEDAETFSMTAEDVRWELEKAAFSLYLHVLCRRVPAHAQQLPPPDEPVRSPLLE